MGAAKHFAGLTCMCVIWLVTHHALRSYDVMRHVARVPGQARLFWCIRVGSTAQIPQDSARR